MVRAGKADAAHINTGAAIVAQTAAVELSVGQGGRPVTI
jgi:hypothetical protein